MPKVIRHVWGLGTRSSHGELLVPLHFRTEDGYDLPSVAQLSGQPATQS